MSNAAVIILFRSVIGAGSSQASDTQLTNMMTGVMLEHDPSRTIEDVTSATEQLALAYLLGDKYHRFRAGKAAEAFPMSVPGEGFTDKSQSVSRHNEEAADCRLQYEQLATSLGYGQGTVRVSKMHHDDPRTGREVPLSRVPSPTPVVLTATGGSGFVTLSWTTPRNLYFRQNIIYRHTSAGLEDPTSYTRSGATHPGVIDAAEVVNSFTEERFTSYKDNSSDLIAGTYYFVMTTTDVNNKVAISNEVSGVVS